MMGRLSGQAHVKRAAVLIGVDRTGDLPELRDAASGARRMEEWARAQEMSRIEVLTDADGGAVAVADVKRAIRAIVDSGTFEQLVVYFAGHGVNIRRGEYWLLSGAPDDPQEAVNVPGSESLARFSGIPHVVLISDACRTAAEGIRAQTVGGSEIFPNLDTDGLEAPVDQFFACTLGRPAHEIRDPDTTAREFSALYTRALHGALMGTQPSALELGGGGEGYVRPRRLKAYLQAELARRLEDIELATKVIQIPDARITSDVDAWLSRVAARSARGGGQGPPAPPLPTPEAAVSRLLHPAAAGDAGAVDAVLGEERAIGGLVVQGLERLRDQSECVFGIRGARIVEALAAASTTLQQSPGGELVQAQGVERPGASVLLVLESGAGVVLPAIPGFVAALAVDNGELVEVAYEPAEHTPRWDGFAERARDVRRLRAVASAYTRDGVFRLEGDDALQVAQRMQYAKGVDPALAVYAAYAYQDLRRRDLIGAMSEFMRDDLGAPFFDVALLAGTLDGTRVGGDRTVLSPVPLLAQGWALLAAHRVRLAPSLEGIEHTLLDSVWTMFDAHGVERLRGALARGDIL